MEIFCNCKIFYDNQNNKWFLGNDNIWYINKCKNPERDVREHKWKKTPIKYWTCLDIKVDGILS